MEHPENDPQREPQGDLAPAESEAHEGRPGPESTPPLEDEAHQFTDATTEDED